MASRDETLTVGMYTLVLQRDLLRWRVQMYSNEHTRFPPTIAMHSYWYYDQAKTAFDEVRRILLE
jgi:hypothetical protein